MKYDEFHKLIEEQNPEKKQFLFKCAMDGLSLPVESMNAESRSATAETQCGAPAAGVSAAQKPKNKRRTSFKRFFKQPVRLAAYISAAVAVACLAIILPFTLKGSGSQTATTNPSTTPEDRFCVAASCKEIELRYSLKEYSARNHLSLLYVDWYAKAEIKTSLHVDNEDQTDIVYYEEILKHKGTGSIAELYITDLHTKVDRVEDYKKVCEYSYIIERPVGNSNILKLPVAKVYWGSDTYENGEYNTYIANFTFGKYEYTLVLRYAMDENSIFELIESMLPWNRK